MKCEELNITQKRKDEIILGALHRFIAVIYEPLDKIFEKVPLSNIILDRQQHISVKNAIMGSFADISRDACRDFVKMNVKNITYDDINQEEVDKQIEIIAVDCQRFLRK